MLGFPNHQTSPYLDELPLQSLFRGRIGVRFQRERWKKGEIVGLHRHTMGPNAIDSSQRRRNKSSQEVERIAMREESQAVARLTSNRNASNAAAVLCGLSLVRRIQERQAERS